MIPVNEPKISRNARRYVLDCIKSGWVSSAGEYIERFESEFAKYLGTKFAVTTTSGTAALHLSLASLGIGKGDEVIIPDLTIISCALSVIYTGATPVLVDVDPVTGNIDPGKIEDKITKKTKVIMVVHLYGHPAEMRLIMKLAKKYKLFVIEDAAEAHGAEYSLPVIPAQAGIQNKKWIPYQVRDDKTEWEKVGGIGDVGCFSFYANKLVTCGEGGMVVTNSKKIYEKLKSLKDLAHLKNKRFFHKEIGFNYRITNLQAALGLAQLEEIESYIKIKRWMVDQYKKHLKGVEWLELPIEMPWAKSTFWMYAVKISQKSKVKSQNLREKLKKLGVETRPFFYPLHKQPVLRSMVFEGEEYPISDDLSKRGFYLPSGLAITKEQIRKVAVSIKNLY